MKKFLITLLLIVAAYTGFPQDTGEYVFRFPGTDLQGLAKLSAPARDSILQAFSRFDPAQISFEGTTISEENRTGLTTVILDMMETVKTVIKDPATLGPMEKKMNTLMKKLDDVQADIQVDEALSDLKTDYEKSRIQRTKEFEDRNYSTEKDKRVARRELEQELRDLRRDYEDDRARIRRR
ncbi:hypothetical protein ACFOTA_23200 [Chitinophaga sp. GCM10012297]|uniref:Uncharacterized protein n=1 Tax=Chitinophaga chungangae TaxID=2821488 RepID=A0ABS3YKC6_9BACT|nr:hypothetical protein [Chitinophaga chungangae]MBO9155136.1 hypothetical protein [Chitinophaga chungangae]